MKRSPSTKQSSVPIPVVVSVRGLEHAYRDRVALQHVTLDIREGEIFGILGPNGSGKTTLFKILTTMLLPSSGDAAIAGQSVLTEPHLVRRHIGVVFQSLGLDQKLTVHENLVAQGHLYGLMGDMLERQIASVIQEFGISDRAGQIVETLSGGLQRRAELAKGMLHAPKILLLDEPSTGLDPGARVDLWLFLAENQRRHRVTTVLTTHLMVEAEHCDRIAIFDRGTVVALGTPEELKDEIGADIISVRTDQPAALAKKLQRLFHVPIRVLPEEILLEWKNAHRAIPKLARQFPELIRSITVRKPTLEDVFLRHTGHRLWSEEMAQ